MQVLPHGSAPGSFRFSPESGKVQTPPSAKEPMPDYTRTMDAERFGRALGIGVRVTGKALKSAVAAAAAPNPRPYRQPAKEGSTSHPVPVESPTAARSVAHSAARTVTRTRSAAAGVRRGSRRFGEAVWAPAARAGGVLWFEVTGSFFALFALAAGFEVWRRRTAFTPGPAQEPRDRAWFALAMFAVFAWFTLSSFLKARRRSRR